MKRVLEETVDGRVIGGLTITKIVREHVPVTMSRDGGSFGTLVDAHIDAALRRGDEVQSFTVDIDPDYWKTLEESFR